MSSDYSYDEQGQFFPFFVLTITALITIPLTYSLLKPSSDPGATAPRIHSDFKPEHADLIDHQRKKQRRRERRLKRIIAVVVGWAIIGFMAYLIMVTARTIPKIWNPYDILGISESASEKAIKSHYKRLSLKFHPDKIKPDPAKNETLQDLNDHFVEITKAYKALTDDEIRNNYIQFGHPDGKQSTSIGIALPSFMVSEGNGKYVIIVYSAVLMILLPWLVGSWWYGTQRFSKEKVLIESANNLFREYEDNISEGGIVGALSSGVEFQHAFKGEKAESGLGKLESRVLAEDDANPLAGAMTAKDRNKLGDLESGCRRKALALLWSYLGRVELDDAALDEAKFQVAPIAHALTQSFNAICLAFGNTAPIVASFRNGQTLVQAMAPKASPLLQLPHFTPAIAKAVEGDSSTHLTLQEYMAIPEQKRRALTIGKGLLSESEYQTAVSVAKQLPNFEIAKSFFKVTGERYITPGSLTTLVVKGRFVPPGTNPPPINESDLLDIDPDEGDLAAIKAAASPAMHQPPLAHAPYFPRDYSPRWHVFLTDSKQGKIAVPPFTFTVFDKEIFDAEGKPTFNMQTLKAQFAAPPQAGEYTFVLQVICDSYVGFDWKDKITLVVEDAAKASSLAVEDDISEPEEDSLAGQMSALKNGGVAPPKRRRRDEESSDEESATDEEDADTSDTNTDTEDEDEDDKKKK